MRVLRRAFLTSSLAAAAIPTLVGTARAAALTTVRVAGPPDFDVISLIWGQRSGIFANYGIDVQLDRLNDGSAVLAAVVGGSYDVGKSGAFQLIQGYIKGIPIVLEAVSATYSARYPSAGLAVAQNSPLASPRDLAGKTIAVPSLGSQLEYLISDWVDRSGGDAHSVKFVALPMTATAFAIGADRIDGAVLTEPYLSQAVETQHCKVIGRPYDTIAPYFGVSWYFAGREYAAKNADVLARFRRGLTESTNYVVAHKVQVLPLIADYTGITVSVLAKILPSLTLGTGADVSMLQPIVDFAARTKLIPKSLIAGDLIDPAIVKSR